MRKAVAHTLAALDAASDVDADRTEDDRRFLASLKTDLELHAEGLRATGAAVDSHDLGPSMRLQARVQLGDASLDRGVRNANARTKTALRDRSGLGSDHVFGRNVEDLTATPMRLEPARVVEAARRLDNVEEFEGKETLQADLIARATRQEQLLGERDKGRSERDELVSKGIKALVDAANALARIKAALDGRFPRQRLYVGEFFLSAVTIKRKVTAAPESPKAP